MINKDILREILVEYKDQFAESLWPVEKYKWEAVRQFQDNWDIDADASRFSNMIKNSLSKTGNLLLSRSYFPIAMISGFAKSSPEEVRELFKVLFDENKNLYDRVEHFKQNSEVFLEKYGNGAKSHYQNENAIFTYLWLRYPDKYYIYKFGVIKNASNFLESDRVFTQGRYKDNIENFLAFYNELNAELKKDKKLIEILQSQLTESCYPDPVLHTLTIDVAFFIHNKIKKDKEVTPMDPPIIKEKTEDKNYISKPNYWFLNCNPKIWSIAGIPVGGIQSYSFYNENGNKRRIFQNFQDANVGDLLIGYESTPVKQIVALAKITEVRKDKEIRFVKTEGLTSPIDYKTLKDCPDLDDMEYFISPQGSLFKLAKEEYNYILDMIREENPIYNEAEDLVKYSKEDFLEEVFMSENDYNRLRSIILKKKNIILQGAPGVGKTYAAKRLAYSIMGVKDNERIEFIQFHQNYSYEDFVMGYKPVEEGFELKFGVFYRFCKKAENHPDKEYFFIVDEINRGNMSKIFGELLMLIEADYRGTAATLAYNGLPFSVPRNIHIIGMMNTSDRSLAMIDYALRRRISFYEMKPGFSTKGFIKYQKTLNNTTLDSLLEKIKQLNEEISSDASLGKGFCIGHSYFCNLSDINNDMLKDIIDYEILPMLSEYWFDDNAKLQRWEGIFHDEFNE